MSRQLVCPPGSLRPAAALAIVAMALIASGCDKSDPVKPATPPPVTGSVVADFHLPDVNPNSTTHGEMVSPRDHVGQISAWYFGHST